MSGGRNPHQKGVRAERALVKLLQAYGLAAGRVPLSGAMAGYPGDLSVPVLGVARVVEVKVRRDGFKPLYDWLKGRDLLIIKADRLPPLVVVPLRLAAEVTKAAGVGKAGGNDGKDKKAESFQGAPADRLSARE
jgi:Holliday junction resolvase